jgi:glycosyltransferase involved in cell wall biosynthesis
MLVGLAGTDLYHDLKQDLNTQTALKWASYLVALQSLAVMDLPRHLRGKTRVIPQSAVPYPASIRPPDGEFRICVLSHLRAVKDPFRAASAAAGLPADSRVRVIHAGKSLEPGMDRRAGKEMAATARYRWIGEVPPARARRILKGSHLLVLSSQMEGGANVVSEAVAAGVPILASRIPGSVGILGKRYPGFFEVGDTRRLVTLIRRCEMEPQFYARLKGWVRGLLPEIHPARERKAWKSLLQELQTEPGMGLAP